MKRLACVLLCAFGLVGCGIQPTAVIPAGNAPIGNQLGSTRPQITLYFLIGGQLSPVRRAWAAETSPTTILTELFGGPSPAEEQQGFYSTLPPGRHVTVDTSGAQVVVTVAVSMKQLFPDGVRQVVCTTAAALAASGRNATGGITVVASDTKLESLSCN
ncbi:hypothetical protein [Amycolatopsis benzoatilytica]|uniref:hypothetical protein n=1 Tax=Amycolatopsis benzoatilytica TaxID=346045 RepID=UPI0003795CFF|nr:hypothetical protein [Amycolatopsis benzoatilytica]